MSQVGAGHITHQNGGELGSSVEGGIKYHLLHLLPGAQVWENLVEIVGGGVPPTYIKILVSTERRQVRQVHFKARNISNTDFQMYAVH